MSLSNTGKVLRERTCNKCGWVHFAVTREHATREVAEVTSYLRSLTQKERDDYYGGKAAGDIRNYERCMLCGGSHTNFRDAVEEDCPVGCTLSPIITD